MPEASVNVRFESKYLNVRLEKNDDDQAVTVSAAERVSLTVSDRVTVNQLVTGGGGGTVFLPTATYCDDTNATYFYFGWTPAQTLGEWLIRRSIRATAQTSDARLSNNPLVADLDAAWPDRATLTYD